MKFLAARLPFPKTLSSMVSYVNLMVKDNTLFLQIIEWRINCLFKNVLGKSLLNRNNTGKLK